METKRIRLADVRPNEKNPRADFGDLDALWESFGFNTANPGEPVNPIVVVADGGVYRIVDGERRYRAMEQHGKEDCMAVVCDGYDDMAQAVQMLATDDKLSLTAQEQCQGIQQMLLLGVDEERVAGASRAPVESVRKVRRVVMDRRCGNEVPTYQATLDQMLAAWELDEEGAYDFADELLADRNWRERYDKHVREKARRDEHGRLVAAAKEAGFELLEEGFDQEDYGVVGYIASAGDFATKYEKGYRYAEVNLNSWGATAHVYMPKGKDPSKTDDELAEERDRAQREAQREEAADQLRRLREDVAEWYAGFLDGFPTGDVPEGMDYEVRMVVYQNDDSLLLSRIAEFEEVSRHEVGGVPVITPDLAACAFLEIYPDSLNGYTLQRAVGSGIDAVEDWGRERAVSMAADLCACVNGFVAWGYEPPEWADALMRKVEQVAKAGPLEKEEGEVAEGGEGE